MEENSNRNRSIRVIIALLLVVAIIYVYNTQDDPFKSPEKLKKDLTAGDLLNKRSPILNPRNIKGYTLPHSVKFVGGKWVLSYRSEAFMHLLTQLYSELSEQISSKPRFSSDGYIESARYRWENDQREYSKEFSLHILELLYKVSGNDKYLLMFLKESEDFIKELNETITNFTLLSRHKAFNLSSPYNIIRLLSYRSSLLVGKDEVPAAKIIDLYRELKSKIKKQDFPINNSCKALWSITPILSTDSNFSNDIKQDVEDLYLDFMLILKEDIESIDSLLTINYCLLAFMELQDIFVTPVQPAFDLAYEKYIIDTLNYPASSGCPGSGGYFTRPPKDGNCQTERMYLYQNILLEYLFYKMNK